MESRCFILLSAENRTGTANRLETVAAGLFHSFFGCKFNHIRHLGSVIRYPFLGLPPSLGLRDRMPPPHQCYLQTVR